MRFLFSAKIDNQIVIVSAKHRINQTHRFSARGSSSQVYPVLCVYKENNGNKEVL